MMGVPPAVHGLNQTQILNLCRVLPIVNSHHSADPSIALVGWHFENLVVYITVILFILSVILLKIAYHKLTYLTAYLPESLLLIGVGLIFGAVFKYTTSYSEHLRLSPELFFNVLLPPIVLESAYGLYNRKFAQILGPILIYACLGTILNFLLIGGGLLAIDRLIGLGEPVLGFGFKEYLLFAALIVAVDPVAVLAIFQDIGVDLSLYYLVFGESLLNDAVTVVLYNIMNAFVAAEEITSTQIAIGVGSFFTVSLGGAVIGLVHGIFCCLLTRMDVASEALIPLIISYMAYIIADLFAWSGIISMIVCGVLQAAYAFHNMTPLSVMLTKSALRQVSAISEAVIFLLLGSEVFALKLYWHTGLTLTALVICLVVRALVVFSLAAIVNVCHLTDSKIEWREQVIISYGGLRGAVAFSLAVLLNSHFLGQKGEMARDVIVTTTLVIILFTVAVMGTTIKPLVQFLRIRLDKGEKKSLFVTLNDSVLDSSLLFIEQLVSRRGYNHMRHIFVQLDDKYIRPVLQRNAVTHNKKIIKMYEKMALQLHSEAISCHSPIGDMNSDDGEQGTKDIPQVYIRSAPNDDDEEEEDDDARVVIEHQAISPRHPQLPPKMRRRLTIADLSQNEARRSAGLETSAMDNWARALQLARIARNQAQLAEQMDKYVKRHTNFPPGSIDNVFNPEVRVRRSRFAHQNARIRKSMPERAGRGLLKHTFGSPPRRTSDMPK